MNRCWIACFACSRELHSARGRARTEKMFRHFLKHIGVHVRLSHKGGRCRIGLFVDWQSVVWQNSCLVRRGARPSCDIFCCVVVVRVAALLVDVGQPTVGQRGVRPCFELHSAVGHLCAHLVPASQFCQQRVDASARQWSADRFRLLGVSTAGCQRRRPDARLAVQCATKFVIRNRSTKNWMPDLSALRGPASDLFVSILCMRKNIK